MFAICIISLSGSIHPTIVPVGSGVPIFCNAEKRERQPPDLLTFKRLNLGELFSGDVHTVQTDEWKLCLRSLQLYQAYPTNEQVKQKGHTVA